MHRAVKSRADHLGDAARIVAVRFVDLRLQHRLHVRGFNTDHRQLGFGQRAEQPLRQRSRRGWPAQTLLGPCAPVVVWAPIDVKSIVSDDLVLGIDMILLHSLIIYIQPIPMITATQLRAARALLGIDQRELAQRCGLSLPTIQRMEASEGVIRGTVDSLVKLVDALAGAGIELIGEGATSSGGGPTSDLTMSAQPANETGGRP